MTPEQVATAALDALGHGPRVVPGAMMKASAALMSRLPRRATIAMMRRANAAVLDTTS